MRTLVPLLFLAALIAAPSLAAQQIGAFGVIRDTTQFNPPCKLLETDDGVLYRLGSDGGLPAGSRVFVKGNVTGFGLCGAFILSQLDNTIEPAFAGTGRVESLDGTPALRTDGGDLYALALDADVAPGTWLYVEARVIGERAGAPLLEPASMGPAFARFGRLVQADSPSGWGLLTPDGVTGLERMSLAVAAVGMPVFVEGLLPNGAGPSVRSLAGAGVDGAESDGVLAPSAGGPSGPGGGATTEPGSGGQQRAPALVRRNVVSLASFFAGTVLASPDGLVVQAENDLFDDVFELPDTRGLRAGQRVFVRGRSLTDFDPLEDPDSHVIRRAKVGAAYSACGQLVSAPGEPPVFEALDGTTLALQGDHVIEYGGPLPHGALRYVVGRLEEREDGSLFLADNTVLEGVILSGNLEQGFECTPLFAPAGGGVFSLEDPPAIPIGDPFTVIGGVSFCEAVCPFPCLIAEEIIEG